MKKILIVVGGGKKHIEPFLKEAKNLDVSVRTASFSDLEYETSLKGLDLTIEGQKVDEFDVVYIRLVGKRFEEAALLVNYCREKNIKLVDKIYDGGSLIRLPLPKSIETKLLIDNNVPTPKTYFGSLENIVKKAPQIFGFPFVIKGTTGKQGHAVWSPRNLEELESLIPILKKVADGEKKMKFIAQEFIEAGQRSRVFVIGKKAVAGITRPTRWRKRFVEKEDEGEREALKPIPETQAKLAVKAAQSLGIDIAGVDLLVEDKTGKIYCLEVNSAPRWESVKKDTRINVEREILEYLVSFG